MRAFIIACTSKSPVVHKKYQPTTRGRVNNSRDSQHAHAMILERLDKNAKFDRFLELPAELREMVYGYLLTSTPLDLTKRSKVFTEILRTSKQVYKEAVNTLLTESTFQLRVRFSRTWDRLENLNLVMATVGTTNPLKNLGFLDNMSSMSDTKKKFLSSLPAKMRYLELEMELQDYSPSPAQNAWPACAIFSTALVQVFPQLKSVKLKFMNHQRVPGGSWNRAPEALTVATLEPFKQLPATCVLDLQGFTEQTEKAIWEMMKAKDIEVSAGSGVAGT